MWLLWPTYENKAGFPSTDVVSDMVAALHGHTRVHLAVQDDADEVAARELLTRRGVPLDSRPVPSHPARRFWTRDMGPQFVRNRAGELRVTDWGFNYWGFEDPDSPRSLFDEPVDRDAASLVGVRVLDTRPGPTGVRMVHEGGSTTHNGHGTMVVVESVVMQRNLGPGRFCGGSPLVTDFSQPNTYAPHPDWPACRALVEGEYRRLLGVKKFIWVPTGVIEDQGTFRGALGQHIRVGRFDGFDIPHAGVYTMFTTNGHPDEYLRFVSQDTVVVAEAEVSTDPIRTPLDALARWLEQQNRDRMARVFDIVSRSTTESGDPIKIVRMPLPVHVFDVIQAGDGTYDYFTDFDRWEDGTTTPGRMLTVWPGATSITCRRTTWCSVSRFWQARSSAGNETAGRAGARSGGAVVSWTRDRAGLFRKREPRRRRHELHQPAAAGECRVRSTLRLGEGEGGRWHRHSLRACRRGPATGARHETGRHNHDIYLERLSSSRQRVLVRIEGPSSLDGRIGWIDGDAIESAGEKCPHVPSPT